MLKVSKQNGFSLIEMIVSLAIFAIVVTTAVGALLVLLSSNQKLQVDQGVMTNLSFALDSMTREIRTGYNYYCDGASDNNGNSNYFNDSNSQEDIIGAQTLDCASGRANGQVLQGVSFYEGGNSVTGTLGANRILYFFDSRDGKKTIMRRVGDSKAQPIISSDLEILNAEFYVTGSTPRSDPSNDTEQPTVTIYIEAKSSNDDNNKVYYLQTTVTQRTLDL